MKILKLIFVLVSAGIIAYFGFVSYLVFSPDIKNYKNRTEFDSKLWKNWEETETTLSLRWDMTHDLTTEYKLVGMSTEQVIHLLGEPSSQSTSELNYYLGMARHGIDTGSLIFKIENGRVVSFSIWHG